VAKHLCRLFGGPFDGDSGTIRENPPPRLWVTGCGCPVEMGGPHSTRWFHSWVQGAEVYRREEEREDCLPYVYEDMNADPRVEESAEVPAPGELVPAGA